MSSADQEVLISFERIVSDTEGLYIEDDLNVSSSRAARDNQTSPTPLQAPTSSDISAESGTINILQHRISDVIATWYAL